MFIMKRILLPITFSFILFLTSCGPAAENREVMHQRAKVFQDSIANMIRSSMAEAEAPARGTVVVSSPGATNAAVPAPAPTVAPKK